jgi:hypothetical protein
MQIRHLTVTSEHGSMNDYWMIFEDGEIRNPKLILSDYDISHLFEQYRLIRETRNENSES